MLCLPTGQLGYFVQLHPEIPRVDEIQMDPVILLFGLGVSLATGVLFGLAPALRACRADLMDAIKQSSQPGSGRVHSRLRDLLVAGQIALAFVLVIGTALLSKSLFRLIDVDPGFDFHNVLTLSMIVYGDRFYDWDKVVDYYQQVSRRVETIPGVEGVAMAEEIPFANFKPTHFHIRERPLPKETDAPVVNSFLVSPGYFQVLKIPLKRGRIFTEQDNLHSPMVVIISESCARSLFPHEDPVGKHVRLGETPGSTPWATIIGIVGDVRNRALDRVGDMGAYVPQAQTQSYYRMLVRTRGEPAAIVPAIRRAFQEIDSSQPIWHMLPMESYVKSSYADRTFTLALIGLFGTLSLLLAAVGIYGVISYTVSLRTREFGIRMALGAERRAIAGLVLREVSSLLAWGVGSGIIAALVVTRALAHLLYEVRPTDLPSSALVVLVLACVALAAGYFPARRAAAIDPASALRYD